jgi:hypothetical protein
LTWGKPVEYNLTAKTEVLMGNSQELKSEHIKSMSVVRKAGIFFSVILLVGLLLPWITSATLEINSLSLPYIISSAENLNSQGRNLLLLIAVYSIYLVPIVVIVLLIQIGTKKPLKCIKLSLLLGGLIPTLIIGFYFSILRKC